MKSVIVIGSGFAGLSAASFLAKEGYDVTILEKNDNLEVELEYGKRMASNSIWDPVGTGCPMSLRGISPLSGKKFPTYTIS